MRPYLLRRLLGIIPILFGITLISFAVIRLAPGEPVSIESSLNPRVSPEVRQRLIKIYGLDKPLHVQYGEWLSRLVRFDFGRSFSDSRPVIDKILERLPLTAGINALSLFIILLFGIPLGTRCALKEGRVFDKIMIVLVFLGFTVLSFWLALLLMNLFGIQLGWLPISGIVSLDHEYMNFFQKCVDLAGHLVLPVFVLSLGGLAGITRYMRSSMLETLSRPYIYTARAKGLPERTVVYKHGLRNAVLPILTILGLSIPGLLGGSVIFESIFSIPGIGRLFYEAVMMRDYPLIMAEVVLGAVLTMLGNLLADIGYALVDPRIRYSWR